MSSRKATSRDENDFVTRPMCFAGAFDEETCDRILDLGLSRQPIGHSLRHGGPNSRSADSHWIRRDAQSRWLFEMLEGTFGRLNSWFNFRLESIQESLLLARYPRGPGFTWHVDALDDHTSRRKLSLSVQLSHPQDYSGGDLEFIPDGPLPLSRLRGTVVAFPSFCAHRVTPITRGERVALVAWIHGPPFS